MPRIASFPSAAAPALFALALALAPPGRAGAATLTWTAPGDNGSTGTAARYDVRRSTQVLTETNFALGDTVAGVPAPAPAGTAQSCAVAIPLRGVTYYFAIKTVDAAGNWSAISNVASVTEPLVDADVGLPREVRFEPPRPNPARSRTALHVETPATLPAEIGVFDAMGRSVRRLWSGPLPAGRRDIEWDLRDARGHAVARGVYFVRGRVGAGTWARRVVVVP